MAEARIEESTSESKFLFRSLRVDEDVEKGLVPRDPNAIRTVSSHLGGAKQSQFISTTATFDASLRWAKLSVKKRFMKRDEIRIVKIDVKKMKRSNVNMIDLTNPAVLDKKVPYNKRLRYYAKCYQEILIEGNITSDCLKLVYPAAVDNLSILTEQLSALNI